MSKKPGDELLYVLIIVCGILATVGVVSVAAVEWHKDAAATSSTED